MTFIRLDLLLIIRKNVIMVITMIKGVDKLINNAKFKLKQIIAKYVINIMLY